MWPFSKKQHEESHYPHGVHLLLFIILLVVELVIFKGHGALSTIASLSWQFTEIYEQMVSGAVFDNGLNIGLNNLLTGLVLFVGMFVVYYIFAGITMLIFLFIFRRAKKMVTKE